MKKLLIILFSTFVMAGCVNTPYKIDEALTAAAPWEVGEIVIKRDMEERNTEVAYVEIRKFLGITSKGGYIVQQFDEETGAILSNPFVLMSLDEVMMRYALPSSVDGPYISYYLNGEKALEGMYQNGRKQGRWNWWYPNGQLEIYATFKNNAEVGKTEMYSESGSLKYSGENNDKGLPQGLSTWWHENQQIKLQGYQEDGRFVGVWREWDEEGNLISERDYSKED